MQALTLSNTVETARSAIATSGVYCYKYREPMQQLLPGPRQSQTTYVLKKIMWLSISWYLSFSLEVLSNIISHGSVWVSRVVSIATTQTSVSSSEPERSET